MNFQFKLKGVSPLEFRAWDWKNNDRIIETKRAVRFDLKNMIILSEI
jgi:hypothetical protein